jgi:bacterioferritin (cytochrome b1)
MEACDQLEPQRPSGAEARPDHFAAGRLSGKETLRFDLENENETIRNYRERVRQCEALGEFAMAEQIRQILVDEHDHQ